MVTTGMIRRPDPTRATPRVTRPSPSGLELRKHARKDRDEPVSIVFDLATNSMVTLAIFNAEGRLVDVLFEGWLWPGRHQVNCCLRGRSPGRYKCLLDTPTVRLVKYIEVTS